MVQRMPSLSILPSFLYLSFDDTAYLRPCNIVRAFNNSPQTIITEVIFAKSRASKGSDRFDPKSPSLAGNISAPAFLRIRRRNEEASSYEMIQKLYSCLQLQTIHSLECVSDREVAKT
jgi:hypothetical protein